MNIKKKCQQINSLLGDLSSTGIQPIPDIVYEMRLLLHKIEAVEQPLALDGGDSAPFQAVSYASSLSTSQAESNPTHRK